ncbi:uncharacterized protein LOC130543284 isoform X3 [Ursus arctos]|uniref:uncharacterized protein LOC130543284 isoform X3 n=1 Tax=Ursus arctos TaxID=9644 RepID=UPI002549B190|nr:uncharacterized protein LOC130543284 isoform X3 [Ursus arctos]
MLFQVVHVVPDRFILGLDGAGVLWNFAILTGYLGICAFLIYIWRTVLAIAPRQYEVTLQQIAEKIHRLKNENRELAKEISIWEEKIRERKKHRAEMKREHQFLSDKILKLKENIGKVERVNANLSVALHFKRTMLQAMREKNVKNEDMAQDALEDEEQGDLESKKRVLKESKKVLEQKCNALSSLKAAKEVELKLLRKKLGIVVDFSERRKVAAEEKLEKTLYELEATKNQLSDAEENLKVTKEEIDKYKQQIGKMQDQLQEAELTFERKIAVHEKNAVGNWIKARVWERKIQQQRRENAYMIHRLRMMKGQMLPEGCMRQEAMLGRPEMWSPPRRGHWSDAEADGAPMRNNGTEPNRHPGMYKVGPDVRGFPRPTCMPCPMDQTLPGFIGCGPPQPPPPWSTCGPPLPLVPPPCGPRSNSETCGAQGDKGGTVPKKDPEKDKVGPDVRGFPRPTCMPCPMDQTLPGFIGCGPPQPPPPWSTCGPPLPLVPPPCGPRSNSETCGAQGDKGGTVPKKDPEKDKVGPDVRGFPRPTCMPCPMDQTLPGFIGCGPPQPPPPWSTCGPPLPLVPPPCGPRSNSETCGAQGDKGGTVPKKDPEKDKVGPDVRGFPRPTCMPCPMDQTLPGFIGCGPPQPPPPWSTCGPPLPLVPPPCGPRSNSETCGAQGDKGGTVPKKDPEKDKVGPDVRGFPRPTCMPCPMDQTLPGFIGCGPPQPPPPWSTCGPPLPLVPPPCGPRSNSETCGAQGDKGGTVPKKDPEKDKVGPDVRGFPRPTCMPCPMDQTLPGFIGCGPPQPPPPWSTCGPPLPLVPPPCGPRSNSETCGAQGDKGGTVPKKDPEKDKVGPDVRGFPRPNCMPCPMDQTLPGFIGCGPPQPPPPWSTCGPPLPLVPPPCGPRSNSETCGAQGDKGGTVPKKDPEKDKVVHVVPDRFILGLDGAGVLWNFAILTGYLGICAFLIYIWRTVLAIAPRQYEVTLQQIAEKIHRLKNENRELAKEISIWEEKIRERKKHRAEMKREHQFLSDKILKLKENIGKVERVNANLSVALHFKRTMLQAMREKNVKNEDMAQDALEDEEQGDLESKKRVLKESKKVLEQKCNALSSLKAAKEVELKLLRKKLGIVVDFSERRKVAAEEKLEKTLYELEATKNQLSDAEENLKVTKEEIDKYKQQIGKMQDQLQEAELTFERKIAVHEKNAVGNWIKARVWERKIQQQRRENAYMIHRLRMMKGQMLPEGCMRQEAMLGRPEMWSPPRRGHWSDAEADGAPMRNNGTEPNRHPGMYKVGPDVRGFPRPTCMPCPMDQTLPGFIGCGPPQPPPPWSTCGPPLPLVPPPCGPRSNSETCGAQGDKGGTVPKKDPEKDKVGPDVRGFPRPTCMPCPMDQTLPGFIGCGPPQPPPPWSTCGPPLPLVPPPCGPRSNSETCGAQGDKGGTVPKKDPEKDKVGPDVRGFPRPTCMPCPMDQTLPGFIGCGPPQPPPPWSTCGPPLPLVPPPCGPRSNSETCGAQGDKGGTVPKKDPEKDKVGPDVRGFPRPTCMPCPMDQTLPGFIGCGPPQPPPPWSTCGPPLPLVPPPCGPRSNSETCGAQGDKGGTVPKKDPEKDKVGPDVRRFPWPTCMSSLTGHITRLHWLWATSPSSTLVVMRALLALRSATMWASVPFRSLWRSRDNSGTAPKEVPEKDKVLYSSPFCTRAPGSCKALLLSRLWKKTSSSSLGVMAGPRCQDAGLFLGRNPEPNSEEREPLSVGT